MPIDNRISAMQYLESRKDEVIPALQLLTKMYDEIEDINLRKEFIPRAKREVKQIYRKAHIMMLQAPHSQQDADDMKEEFEYFIHNIDMTLDRGKSVIERDTPSFSLDTTSMVNFMKSLNDGYIEILAYSSQLQKITKELKKTIKDWSLTALRNINVLFPDDQISEELWAQFLNTPQE